jgi:hypothetical protein
MSSNPLKDIRRGLLMERRVLLETRDFPFQMENLNKIAPEKTEQDKIFNARQLLRSEARAPGNAVKKQARKHRSFKK